MSLQFDARYRGLRGLRLFSCSRRTAVAFLVSLLVVVWGCSSPKSYRTDFGQLVSDDQSVCTVTSGGALRCFQLDYASTPPDERDEDPVLLSVDHVGDVTSLKRDTDNLCFLGRKGDVRCLGPNDMGQISPNFDISYFHQPTTIALPGPASSIAVGRRHGCAIVDGSVHCWGNDAYGQASGVGREPELHVHYRYGLKATVRVNLPEGIKQVHASNETTCARGDSGSVYCWGKNRFGEVGVPDGIDVESGQSVAKVPLPQPAVKLLDEREEMTCALLADASIHCWGNLEGSRKPIPTGPVALKVSTRLQEISGQMGMTSDGKLVFIDFRPFDPRDGFIKTRLTPIDTFGKVKSYSGSYRSLQCWVLVSGAAYCRDERGRTTQIGQY